MHLRTIGEAEATGRVAELYRAQKDQNGFVMEAMQCWTARPDLLPIYQEFSDRIRSGFSLSPRDWRVITFIAAKHVPSTYCSHVYGRQLIADFGSKEAVMAVQRDFRSAGLSERDVRAQHLKPAQAADALRDGAIDALFEMAGAPASTIAELAAKAEVTLLAIDDASVVRLPRSLRSAAR